MARRGSVAKCHVMPLQLTNQGSSSFIDGLYGVVLITITSLFHRRDNVAFIDSEYVAKGRAIKIMIVVITLISLHLCQFFKWRRLI